jgi:SnoaL-like domain
MAVHTELVPTEAADRLALREPFDGYAHCADRRDAEGRRRSSPTTPSSPSTWTAKEASRRTSCKAAKRSPRLRRSQPLRGDDAFQRPSTATIDGNRATGESYTIAHHVFTEDGDRKIMIASLRYLDTFAKIDGRWFFAERKLTLDWSETRSLGTEEEG